VGEREAWGRHLPSQPGGVRVAPRPQRGLAVAVTVAVAVAVAVLATAQVGEVEFAVGGAVADEYVDARGDLMCGVGGGGEREVAEREGKESEGEEF
jgi:hypothetical protein